MLGSEDSSHFKTPMISFLTNEQKKLNKKVEIRFWEEIKIQNFFF
jgi:hypothetical protein